MVNYRSQHWILGTTNVDGGALVLSCMKSSPMGKEMCWRRR